MNDYNIEKIEMRIRYSFIFLVWIGITFLCFVNIEEYYDNKLESLIYAIIAPLLVTLLFVIWTTIVLFRYDKRISAIEKIGNEDSWDIFEIFELCSIFTES